MIMKLYLSSYRIGKETHKLKELLKNRNKKVAYISNALDFTNNLEKKSENEEIDINLLKDNGFIIEKLDLREYFGREGELRSKIHEYGMLRVGWWNCFVLRKAMELSGLDNILIDFFRDKYDLVYWGYSAGICVLGPTLNGLEIVDDPARVPYDYTPKIIYDWLWILDFSIVPHYKSDHKESELVNGIVEYYISNKMLFKTLSDWEVLIIE